MAAAPELEEQRRAFTYGSQGYGSACQLTMHGFHYIYILRCLKEPGRHYIGCTEDLKSRLKKHNNGEVPHTSKHKPWKIKTAIAFKDRERAIAFERYLKTASGRAFAKKRL